MKDPFIEKMPSSTLLETVCKNLQLSHLKFIRKMENVVYSATKDNKNVFLRLTSSFRRSKNEIAAELEWIEYLAANNLPVVKIIHNAKGHLSLSFNNDGQQFEACLFEELKGRHPSEQEVIEPHFLFNLGALIARMHLASKKYTPSAHKRDEWNNERGIRHAKSSAALSDNESLKNMFQEKLLWLNQHQKNLDNYGLIHADLGASNLFITSDGSIHIIDFDDSCYHWYIFDLAVVIYSRLINASSEPSHQNELQTIEDLVRGYRSIIDLPQKEAALIPKFIDFACLRLYFWIEDHQRLNTFEADARQRVQLLKKWIEKRFQS